MKASYKIDWLRYTHHPLTEPIEHAPPHDLFRATDADCRPAPFFDHAVKWNAGRLDWCDREDMPHMVTFSGDDLIKIRRHVDERTLIAFAMSLHQVKVTRLDFAIDVYGGFSAGDVESWLETGDMQKSAKKVVVIAGTQSGKSTGKTVYVGARQSEKMLRIYDKGLQTGERDDWTRVELEMKGDVATKVAREMATKGVAQAGTGAIAKFASAKDSRWQRIMECAVDVDTTVGRKETDHERWLKTVVYPNFARACREGEPGALETLRALADLL